MLGVKTQESSNYRKNISQTSEARDELVKKSWNIWFACLNFWNTFMYINNFSINNKTKKIKKIDVVVHATKENLQNIYL